MLTACQSVACTGKLGTVTALRLDYNNVSILVAAGVAGVTLKRLQQAAQAYKALHVQLQKKAPQQWFRLEDFHPHGWERL